MADTKNGNLSGEQSFYPRGKKGEGVLLKHYEEVLSSIEELVRALQDSDRSALEQGRDDFLSLRTLGERIARRYQIAQPKVDQDFDRTLWWFSENGNWGDLAFLRGLSVPTAKKGLVNMTIKDIEKRLRRDNFQRWRRWMLMLAAVVVFFSCFITVCLTGPAYFLTWSAGLMVIVFSTGFGTSALLLVASITSRRNSISTVCFATAGFLMLTEVASVIHHAVVVLKK